MTLPLIVVLPTAALLLALSTAGAIVDRVGGGGRPVAVERIVAAITLVLAVALDAA